MTNSKNDAIINNLRNWAKENKDIICMFVGGAQGNENKIADEYSDIDVVVFAKRRHFYDKDLSWIKKIGELAYYHEYNLEVPLINFCHKIYFTNGARLDLMFWDKRVLSVGSVYLWLRDHTKFLHLLPRLWRRIIENHFSYLPKYTYRGLTMLADKKNYLRRIQYISRKFKFIQSPFSQEKLQNIVNRFWVQSYSAAVAIARNELMHVKIMGDHAMKYKLLELIEVYMKCRHGNDFDVFEKGRYLEKWAPDFILEGLENIFGHYEADDSWNALVETMDLFTLICNTISTERPDITFSSPEQYFRNLIAQIDIKRSVHAM